jgi:hypothetical protein
MFRYKLRTLLIVLALLPPAIAWMVTPRVLQKVPLADGKQVVFRARRFGLSGYGLSGGPLHVELQTPTQTVRVDSAKVSEIGGRQVDLPACWSTVQVTLYGTDFGIVLDGKTWK